MKIKKHILILMILLMIYIFSGCKQEDLVQTLRYDEENIKSKNMADIDNKNNYDIIDATYEYQMISDCGSAELSSYYGAEIEPNLKIIKINFNLMKLDNSDIYFDKDIDIDSRKLYAKNICEVLDYMTVKYMNGEKISLYVSDKLESCFMNDKIYLKYEDDFSIDDIAAQVLLGIYGQYSNYGLVYGEVIDIMKNLNIDMKSLTIGEMKSTLLKSPEYLDLMYPLFAEEYRDDVNLYISKSLAISFVDYLKSNLSQEEFISFLDESSDFTLDFDKKYIKYMNAYLLENDIDYKMTLNRIPVRSCKNMNSNFRINISTDLANYKFEDEYAIDFMNTDHGNTYKEVIEYVYKQEDNLLQLTFYWDEIIADKFKHANVYFINNKDFKLGGVKMNSPIRNSENMWENDKIIIVKTSDSFLHEMTHYLYDDYVFKSNSLPFIEGRAVLSELLCTYDVYRMLAAYYELGYSYPVATVQNSIYKTSFDEYMKSIGKYPFGNDIFTDEQFKLDYLQLCVYIDLDWDSLNRSSTTYIYGFGTILSKYIIDNYGIDVYKEVYNDSSKMYDLCDHHTIYNFEIEIYNYLYDKFGEI